uniref:Adenylate cyclase n=1 Tax=Rhabditophanes sp. KR3021 TaxID=114890 RepID=A0AC35UF24_9BILA
MPRHRRVFLVISITFAIINVCCVATINFEPARGVFDVDEDLEANYPVGKQMYILFFLQTLMIIVGLICDAHSAGSRGNIERKIVDAVTRRTELETLKDRQDQLLLSVIPAYLTDKVSKSWQSNKHHKLFHDLHVQSHDNVSILFADIVNFTVLAKQLGAKDLVRTLNELYSKFDEDAQKLQCMRIKFLGDCYYCVSGMPVNRPNHADMCVLMGLEMIKIIKQVRVATGVDVNMRIGINSGNVLCGILGLKRWCFDVFSEDVEIAEHCEATGKPGAVHITQKTKDMLVGDYCIVEANLEDPFLLKRGEPTYYILPDKATIVERTASIYRNKRRNLDLVGDEENMCSQNRLSLKTKFTKITESWGADSTYSTPFANLNRTSVTDVGSARRPINNNTVQCMTLIENNLNKMNFSNVKSVMNCTTKRNEDQTAKMLFPFAKKPININLSECSIFPGYGINYMLTLANYKILSSQITTIIIHLVAAYVLLLFVEWITEYEHKIEAACDIAFKNEENDIQTIKDINTLLIENILPSTVAAKFLEPNRLVDELYARDHNNVCVMFASIPNFKEFCSQCETSRKLEYLRLLNEIICEFDKLLSKPKFSGIEKIKTVSSTYMAASGITEYDGDYNKQKNVLSMVEYALTMSAVLDQLNLDSFQNFHLRVGVSLGSVVAGVIGSQKPAFDIWSNTVNMASRMDSHGVVSQIHMTQEVADILINEG